MEYKLSNLCKNFEPFGILYHNDKTGSVYLQAFTSTKIEENIPAIISNRKTKSIEKFTIMREFYTLLNICNIDLVKQHNISLPYSNTEANILDLINKVSKFYSIIFINNNTPIRILDSTINVNYNKKYIIIPSSLEKVWFRAIKHKPYFSLLSSDCIPEWTPQSNTYYPSIFKQIIHVLKCGVYGKEKKKEKQSPFRHLNNDLLLNIIQQLVADEYCCPYYHLYSEIPGRKSIENYEVWNKSTGEIQLD